MIFLSASVPDGKKQYPGSQHHHASARPQWIRDAVLAFARATLKRDWHLTFGAHPSISPMVLTVAREFPPSQGPRISIYQSEIFRGRFPQETLALADGHWGEIIETKSRPGSDPLAASLAHMRERMFAHPGLVAGVFVGGMNGILDEAMLFKRLHPTLPAYAIASAGGAAADLLNQPSAPLTAEDFCGGQVAPVNLALLRQERVGYVRAARVVLDAIGGAIGASGPPP